MPHISESRPNYKTLHMSYAHQSVSKKILIEQTSVLLIIAFIIFKTVLFLWPEDVTLPSLHSVLFTLPLMLKGSPLCLGLLLNFVTWHVMYLDSETPGINPPTPLSATKYRVASGANFHINYMFAMAVGPVVTLLLYSGWI